GHVSIPHARPPARSPHAPSHSAGEQRGGTPSMRKRRRPPSRRNPPDVLRRRLSLYLLLVLLLAFRDVRTARLTSRRVLRSLRRGSFRSALNLVRNLFGRVLRGVGRVLSRIGSHGNLLADGLVRL